MQAIFLLCLTIVNYRVLDRLPAGFVSLPQIPAGRLSREVNLAGNAGNAFFSCTAVVGNTNGNDNFPLL